MQLNGKVFKGVRSARSFWITFLSILLGIVFIGLGVYFYVTDSAKTYQTTTATITEINSETIAEEENFYVILSYTDDKGVSHSGIRLNAHDNSWAVGKEIEIKYNVDNPEEIRTTAPTFVLPLIFVALGAISLTTGIFVCINTVKTVKRRAKNTEEAANAVAENNLTDTDLFFHFTGKAGQSYSVEDKQGKILYECKLLKFNPFGSNLYEFINTETQEKKQIKVGKTFTFSSGDGMMLLGDVLSSRFKIDGVNCWDYVADKGYEIKHLLEGKTVISYQIVKENKTVAHFYPANVKDPFNEDSKNFLRMGKGCYRLRIIDANLSDMVMIAFIISRTEIVE